MTVEEFRILVELGIIGKVEYYDGAARMAGIPLVLSPAQQRAAAEHGLQVSGCVEAVLDDPLLRAQALERLRSEFSSSSE